MKKKIKKTANKKSTAKKTTKTARKSFAKNYQMTDIKTLGLLATALVVVVLAALFVARLNSGSIFRNSTKNTNDQSKGSESAIKVPKNVSQCPKNFYEKTNGNYKIDASKHPKETICQYYNTVNKDKEEIHNL